MTVADRVLRAVRKHGLVTPGGRVVVALSGGADSVALVHLLRELEGSGALTLAGVGHFNHQLRGADAETDELFCRTLAAQLALPIEVGRADVRALAREQRRSVEDLAREVRYAFLEDAATRLAAEAIAVAHTVEDQAETFLLRLIRGAGPRGLAGIRPRAGRVVRPLIEIRRAELRSWIAERGHSFREDASNADLSIPRNRVRHELLPYLAQHFSAGIVEVLAREAAIARDDEAYMGGKAIDLAGLIVLRETDSDDGGPRVRVDPIALTSLPSALGSRVARMALDLGAPGRFAGFEHVARFLGFARSARPGGSLSLPGQQAVRLEQEIVLEPAPPRRAADRGSNSFRFPLSIPGEVVLAAQGWTVEAAEEPPQAAGEAGELAVRVLASAVQFPLVVRSRAPGDVVRPAGMMGRRKKLQDLFVDRKVPRALRDSVPLVVDATGRIVWVVGEPVAEGFRPGGASAGVIFLKARRLGGPG
ncbi:tRNA lysidine(34) synthetase TilS [soil metagenome]